MDEILRYVKKFTENPTTIMTVPFYCGGSFTLDATARSSEATDFSFLAKEASTKTDAHTVASVSGWGAQASAGGHYNSGDTAKEEKVHLENKSSVSVTFKQQSKPENCSDVSEVCSKLDMGVQYWSLTPDLSKSGIKQVKIDIIQMMKQQTRTNNDKILKEAADFLEGYLDSHSHFHVLGSKFTLSKMVKQLSRRNRLPVSFLYPSDNIVLSFIEDVKQIQPHEGSQPMFIISIEKRSRLLDNLRSIREYINIIDEVSLQKVCLHVFSEVECIEAEEEMKNGVKEKDY